MRVNSSSKPRRACLKLVGDDEVLVFADGHDDAIVGVADREGVLSVVTKFDGLIFKYLDGRMMSL